ncbi:MAG: hypothetical protein GX763_09675 [Clostridiaceae bacterium]|nr:hypothetical protein [Clostridiaceae bacterium]
MWTFLLAVIAFSSIAFLVYIGSLMVGIQKSARKHKEEAEAKATADAELERKREEELEKTRPLREARMKLASEYQKEIDKGWQVFISSNKPVTTASVAKVGHEDKYHYYHEPYDAEVDDKAEVYHEEQYGNDYDDFRDAYVVSIGDFEVGELTENTINKIEQHTPWDDAVYSVASVREDSAGKPRIRLNVYEQYTAVPGHREWPMGLRGINFEGRAEIVKENGASICKLDPTTYEGEPAVRVLDALDREMGWVPKEHAAEVTNHINKGKISKARIDNIEYKEDQVYARLFLLIKNYI